MDENKQNQRLLIAASLCFGVIMVWQAIFPPKKPPPRVPPPELAALTATTSAAPPVGLVPTSTIVAAPTQGLAVETIEIKGEVGGAREGRGVPYVFVLSNLGGVIESATLPSFFERDASNTATDRGIVLAVPTEGSENAALNLAGIELDAATFTLSTRPVYEILERGPERVRFRHRTVEGVEIEREYTFKADSFQVELAVTIRNQSRSTQRHRLVANVSLPIQPGMDSGGSFFSPAPDHLEALCYTAGKTQRKDHKTLKDERFTFGDSVKWVAVDRQYFVSGLVPRDSEPSSCSLRAEGKRTVASLSSASVELKPGEEKRHKFTAYVGVKQPKLLSAVEAELESAIDYTVLGLNLAIVCQGLLAILGFIHGFSGSWGVAILGLTLIVKLTLFPLNQRSGRSMRAMAALKPEMDALKVKFPNDQQRQSEEMLKLYRQYGVNPASGCLPVLIQMPIWFALYRALWVSVDLYQESFMWLPDLTTRDPFWVLPIVLVGVMFLQQKMTPSTMDPQQQKIMLWVMPPFFGSMMAALPSGLAFYILVNSLLTIVQQHFINKSVGPMEGSASTRQAAAT